MDIRTAVGTGGSWLITGVALVASVGWLVERRRRRLLETQKDPVLETDIPPSSTFMADISAIGEATSRREATVIDLHQLAGKLGRRRERRDFLSAAFLLQQHLADFRYTSPWVFLELLELYRSLGRAKDWEVARQAFRLRFGQNAPAWQAPSTAAVELLADRQLSAEIEAHWPYREVRMVVLHWMLGDHESRQKCSGPPLLGLGVYRDLMFLDAVLDKALTVRPEPVDSLL